MRYRVSAAADRDLDQIFLYWAKRVSVETADRLIERVTERFRLLGEYPDAGKLCADIAHGVRCFPAGRYLIYYQAERPAVNILHIFHGARDQKSVFDPR
jgi:toxin ParE1/3/4